MSAYVNVNDDGALALRALQKIDQIESLTHRGLLTEAQDSLGKLLGLECTGSDDGDGYYKHNDTTCPIHEWLCEEDAAVAEAMQNPPSADAAD